MVCALWGIGLLQAGGAEAAPAKRASQKAPCPAEKKPDDPSSLEICYHDFSGSRHKFTCPLNVAPHDEDEAFGLYLDHEKIFNELDGRLAEEIRKRIENAGEPLAGYANVEITHDREAPQTPSSQVLWHYKPLRLWKSGLPGALRQTTKEIEDQMPKLADDIYQGYVHERGFAFKPWSAGQGQETRELEIAYKSIADKERAILADCYTLFVREAAPEDDAAIVNLLLAALQEMPLLNDEYPPVEEEGRYIDGFWVPLKVLKSRHGDCDSKSVAFCSLWQTPGPQIVLFVNGIPEEEKDGLPSKLRTDRHALLGIEAIPGTKQAFEEIGNRKYVLCEVVARLGSMEKLHQGKTLFSFLGRQKYCMTRDCGFEP